MTTSHSSIRFDERVRIMDLCDGGLYDNRYANLPDLISCSDSELDDADDSDHGDGWITDDGMPGLISETDSEGPNLCKWTLKDSSSSSIGPPIAEKRSSKNPILSIPQLETYLGYEDADLPPLISHDGGYIFPLQSNDRLVGLLSPRNTKYGSSSNFLPDDTYNSNSKLLSQLKDESESDDFERKVESNAMRSKVRVPPMPKPKTPDVKLKSTGEFTCSDISDSDSLPL